MGRATHVLRMSVILLTFGVAGFAAQRLLRPGDFDKTGNFRYGGIQDLLSKVPVHQTKAVCRECHGDICEVHDKDIHFGVQCEDCHGPGNIHVRRHRDKDATIAVDDARLPKEYSLEGCLFCHRRLEARPRSFPQIDPGKHYEFLHVKDPGTRCIECHSPHEPLFLLKGVEDARIHPVIQECTYCHESKPEGDHKEVKGHPVIFACGDCHPALVKDFQGGVHSFMECTGCHLFHGENDTAGRIFANGNRRFCLLCHEAKPFKDLEAVKGIDPEKHISKNARRAGKDATVLGKDPRACLACHMDFIHDPDLLEKGE